MKVSFSFLIFRRVFLPVFALILACQQANADLVPFGAEWRYLDNGVLPQAGWQNSSFNDNAWSSGQGQFGYGDGDEATVVGYGADSRSKPITTYFRHQFDVAVLPADPLRLSVQRDAGVVVYLNGEEIFRDNLPGGAITSNTRALTPIHGPVSYTHLTLPTKA